MAPNAKNNPQKQRGAARKTAAPKMSKPPTGKGYGGTKQSGKGKPSAGGKAAY